MHIQHIWMRASCSMLGCPQVSTSILGVDLQPDRPQAFIGSLQSSSDWYSPCETRHLDYLLQFTSDICFIEGEVHVPANAVFRGINALLLDTCVEYQNFVK